jgi:NitT/TauT family transport system permease protein
VSLKTAEAPLTESGDPDSLASGFAQSDGSRPPLAEGRRALVAIFAPVVAALVALQCHLILPNAQVLPITWMDALPAWQHPYPVAIEALGFCSLLLAFLYWAWLPARSWVSHNAPLLAGGIGLLCVWDLVTLKLDLLPMPYFPGPNLVLGGTLDDFGILFDSTCASLQLLLTGYALGVCAGVFTGVLIGWYPNVRYWGMPLMKVIGPLPATALVPAVMMLSRESFIPATALIAFAVWFPVTMLTSSGIANVRLSYLDVAKTLGAGESYLIFHVAIPSALPNIFIGLFMGLGASFLTLIVAETVGVQAGLGWYVKWQQGYMEYAKMYGALILMAFVFSGLMTLLFKTRDWVLTWQKGVIKW